MSSRVSLLTTRWALVSGSIVLTIALGALAVHLMTRGSHQPDPLRFGQKISSFMEMDRTNPPPDQPILFVGSSSIRLWPTDSLFRDLPVINRGFGGSHISDVNYYVRDVVLPYAPSVIVFYAGDNDVNGGKPPAKVLRDYQEFVTHVRSSGLNPRILFLAIKPSPSRWDAWPRMIGAGGRPLGNLFIADSLHLSDEGYQLWTGILRPLIDRPAAD